MPSGNGAKAQQKRERNIKRQQESGGGGKSQLKTNEAAKTTICNVCRASFLCTAKESELKIHSDNKHPKHSFQDCFPTFGQSA